MGRLPDGLPGDAARDQQAVGAVVRDSRRREAVHAALDMPTPDLSDKARGQIAFVKAELEAELGVAEAKPDSAPANETNNETEVLADSDKDKDKKKDKKSKKDKKKDKKKKK